MIKPRRFDPSIDLNRGRIAVNMHIHSSYSLDAYSSVNQLLVAARKAQIGLSITDHNSINGSLEASQAKDVFIVPGVEVSVGPGIHLLLYFGLISELSTFDDRLIRPYRGRNPFILECSVEETIKQGQLLGATIALPHPYKTRQGGIRRYVRDAYRESKILGNIHAIEALNAMTKESKNAKAFSWAQRSDKVVTAGSDGHSTYQIDRAVTLATAKTPADFLTAVRKGQSELIGREFTFPYMPYLRVIKEWRLILRKGGNRILADQIKYNLFKRT